MPGVYHGRVLGGHPSLRRGRLVCVPTESDHSERRGLLGLVACSMPSQALPNTHFECRFSNGVGVYKDFEETLGGEPKAKVHKRITEPYHCRVERASYAFLHVASRLSKLMKTWIESKKTCRWRRVLPSIVAGWGTFIASAVAGAQEQPSPLSIHVEHHAGTESCPDARQLVSQARDDEQMQFELVPTDTPTGATIRVDFERLAGGGGLRGTMRTVQGASRVFEDESCEVLTEALSAALLVWLDTMPELRGARARRLSQEPVQQATTPAVLSSAKTWNLLLGAGVVGGIGLGGSWPPGPGASFRSIWKDQWSAGIALAYLPARNVEVEGGLLGLAMGFILADLCWHPSATPISLRVCSLGTIGARRIEPDGFRQNFPTTLSWGAIGGGVGIAWRLGRRIYADGSLNVLAPIVRDSFSVQSIGEVYRAAPVLGLGACGLVVDIL